MKGYFRRLGPALIVMGIIFLSSGAPLSALPSFGIWNFLVYKAAHICGYALLAAAFYHALNGGRGAARIRIAFYLTVLYALSDEWHQRFVSGRNCSLQDVGIDAIGALIGLAIFGFFGIRSIKSHNGTKY
jgi:VanZ family protein